MSTQDTSVKKKLEAIETIVSALKDFEEADANDIIAFARKHLGFGATAVAQTFSGGSTAQSVQQPPVDSIARFVAEKSPHTDHQRVAVLGYFLFHARGVSSFSLKDLVAANTEARHPAFSNISVAVNKALTRYKYISQAQGGQRGLYSITVQGDKLVESLPSGADGSGSVTKRARSRKSTKTAKKPE